jgi:hypothetical protein
VFLRVITLFLITFATLHFSCGGASDVGNPDISGKITNIDGSPAVACEVILGLRNCDPGTIDTVPLSDELTIHMYTNPFDTVKTDQNGYFVFKNVEPDDYALFAARDNMLGICKVRHQKSLDPNVEIVLNYASKLTIDSYNSSMDSNPKAFVSARILGTPVTPLKDIKDRLYFPMVPSGIFDIILYRNNKEVEYVNDLKVKENDNAIIQVNPQTKPNDWTYRLAIRKIDSRPYVLNYHFTGVPDTTLYNVKYDCWIQFSHDMDTRATGNAISVFSSDSMSAISSLHWEGSNQLFIDLCTSGTKPCIDESSVLNKGIRYSLAWPDTITLTP